MLTYSSITIDVHETKEKYLKPGASFTLDNCVVTISDSPEDKQGWHQTESGYTLTVSGIYSGGVLTITSNYFYNFEEFIPYSPALSEFLSTEDTTPAKKKTSIVLTITDELLDYLRVIRFVRGKDIAVQFGKPGFEDDILSIDATETNISFINPEYFQRVLTNLCNIDEQRRKPISAIPPAINGLHRFIFISRNLVDWLRHVGKFSYQGTIRYSKPDIKEMGVHWWLADTLPELNISDANRDQWFEVPNEVFKRMRVLIEHAENACNEYWFDHNPKITIEFTMIPDKMIEHQSSNPINPEMDKWCQDNMDCNHYMLVGPDTPPDNFGVSTSELLVKFGNVCYYSSKLNTLFVAEGINRIVLIKSSRQYFPRIRTIAQLF